ncbi:MAG: hydroxymethylbilane synthase, partial [Planctomycetes bacterium]|nr:hydroxymethylbilane synthase [Planctomycetota bacterium]
MKKILRVGSRESRLAIVQATTVMDAIQRSNPDLALELITMKTTGDKILGQKLDTIGGKGLFVKELEPARLEERVDICVHSY